MNRKYLQNLTLTALFLALGLVLPFLTGQIQQIGNKLLPMHIPVFLCALICGWKWSTPMAFIMPILRSFIFGMPSLYPSAVAMAFELATYAFVAGYLYATLKKRSLLTVYVSIIAGMLAGRAVWGLLQIILLGLGGKSFTLAAFIAGAFTNAVPGIILQLLLIPAVMLIFGKAKFRR